MVLCNARKLSNTDQLYCIFVDCSGFHHGSFPFFRSLAESFPTANFKAGRRANPKGQKQRCSTGSFNHFVDVLFTIHRQLRLHFEYNVLQTPEGQSSR